MPQNAIIELERLITDVNYLVKSPEPWEIDSTIEAMWERYRKTFSERDFGLIHVVGYGKEFDASFFSDEEAVQQHTITLLEYMAKVMNGQISGTFKHYREYSSEQAITMASLNASGHVVARLNDPLKGGIIDPRKPVAEQFGNLQTYNSFPRDFFDLDQEEFILIYSTLPNQPAGKIVYLQSAHITPAEPFVKS